MSAATVNFGLIGFGGWGRMHGQAIELTDGANLVAIAVPSEASREEARRLHPAAKVYDHHEAMLADGGLDFVAVVSPNDTHSEIATAALESGCHVLVEKPMALSLRDCQRLVDLADRHKRLLVVGHELRLSSQWGEIKRLIESSAIGTPLHVLVELSRKPYRLGSAGWRYDLSRVGSWVLEEPVHFFDLARWYLAEHGEAETIYATANSIDESRPALQDNFSAVLRYASGAYAVVTQTLAAFEHHQTVKVTGTKGSLSASWSGAMDRTLEPVFSLKHHDGERLHDLTPQRMSGEVFELRAQMEMCVNLVRAGGKPAATGEDGLWSVGLCLAAEESARSGQVVQLVKFFSGEAVL
jgi:predicted dehydrogenase